MAMRQSKKKRPRREDKMDKDEWPLEEGVFDRRSLLTLVRFMRKGVFKTLDYCIAEGKEANVYRGTTADGQYVAIKIYRLRSPSFQKMEGYVQGDRRFAKGPRGEYGFIYTWCRKEYQNLVLMEKLGVRAPKAIGFKNNVLGMEFLGENGVPFSTLAATGSADPNRDYALIREDIEKLRAGGLVHADVSEYNVLMTDKGPYLIDVGQAVLSTHPSAEEFYNRDLLNLRKYFSKCEGFKPGD